MAEERKKDKRTLGQKMSTGLNIGLWVAAVVLMLAAVVYQRMTGPTHPQRESFSLGQETYRCRLIRSHETTGDAVVEIPDPGGDAVATLYYRKYRFDPDYSTASMIPEDGRLSGKLPVQPAAGKLEYYIELNSPDDRVRVPAGDDTVIIRFKGPVPAWALIPHIAFMFFAILIGMRAGLSALFTPSDMRRWSWITLLLITGGGMILGPIVQKYAFGAYWTGFPFGYDLTDNKTLIMWLVWIIALGLIVFWKKKSELTARLLVLAACVVMVWVYLIPHSMRGSELDYSKVEQGADAADAIGTGD